MKKVLLTVKKFILNRLDERSTWRGIIAGLTACSVALSPEQVESIVTAGVAFGSVLEMIFPDNNETKIGAAMKKEKEEIDVVTNKKMQQKTGVVGEENGQNKKSSI